MSRKNKNYVELLEQGKDLIDFYLNHPCIAAYDLLGVDLAPIQRLVFRDMWFKDYVIVAAGRGFGKSYLLGLISTLSALLKPGYRVGLIGPAFRQCFPIKTDSYDTFWTSNGLMSTVSEFYTSIVPTLTATQSFNHINRINNKWLNDERDCVNIITNKGYDVSGTVGHKIKVLSNDFSLLYKNISEITYDDFLVIKTNFNYFGNNNSMPDFSEFEHNCRTKDCDIPDILTPDLAYWMGLLVGDGCISVSKDKRKQRISFVSEDQYLLDVFEKYLREYFLTDKEEKINRDNIKNDTWQIEYYCKKLVHYLLKCGFTKTTALDKKIPDIIKKASKEIFIAFLQGLFDTDGGVYIQNHKHNYSHCEVTFNTSSKRMAKEVQSVFLNLGIVSNFGVGSKECIKKLKCGNRPSICSEGYKIRITGYDDLYRFKELIGFRLSRKKNLLLNYVENMNLKRSNRILPNKEDGLINFLYEIKKCCTRGSIENKLIGKFINTLNYSNSSNLNMDTIRKIIDICHRLNIKSETLSNIKYIYDNDLLLVSPIKFEKFKAKSVDIEVENEHCYWANGFINHNSKMIFAEVEKLYAQSSIFQEACVRAPIRNTDSCVVKFKSVGGMAPSHIEAVPLGNDGGKIRGSRFYLITVDELAQIPDSILDLVIRPFGATSMAPMERVRRLEEQERLIKAGLAQREEFGKETVNKMIMTSSGYYKFNHMWRRMKDHWQQVKKDKAEGKESPYAVWQIPYWDLPKGFLDMNNIEEAKRVMSNQEFRMEYEAAMISDSEGFFKASLIEACTLDSGHTIETHGEKGAQYILGIDPNQGGATSTGIVIVKIGSINRIVNVIELKKKTTPQLTVAIQELCDSFNVIRIFMDKGGGGSSIRDLLEEGYNGCEPIIDRTNDDHKHLEGRHILEMINFNPAWISEANFTTKSYIEDKKLLFPEVPIGSLSDQIGLQYENVNTLKSQMLSIIVTQTATSLLHFDTPSKSMNKDLYSALILAAQGAKMMEKELEGDIAPILHNSGGMIRPRGAAQQANFRTVAGSGPVAPVAGTPFHAALLKKK